MSDKQREIDWTGAEVKQGDVVLPLTGAASKDWSERFDAVLTLLAQTNGGWGEIGLTKKAIKVGGLRLGAEDDLRHFLESVVVQVNSELAPQPDAQAAEPEDPQARQDAEMSERLRSFAAGEKRENDAG